MSQESHPGEKSTASGYPDRTPPRQSSVSFLFASLVVAVSGVAGLIPRAVLAEAGEIPRPGADASAFRTDSDVIGWNSDFSEMAAVGSEIRRDGTGKQRGEIFLLIFNVGEVIPKTNMHTFPVTQESMPHDPSAIKDVRDYLWTADVKIQEMWPKRPIRKRTSGAMDIKTLWDIVEVEPGLCQPTVGFLLTWNGKVRYLAHQAMRLKESCQFLHHTDERTYWAKNDLGAVMIRFDYSPSENNEQSIRFPLTVPWYLGRTPRVLLETGWPENHPNVQAAKKILKGYGAVTVRHIPGLRLSQTRFGTKTDFVFLARRLMEQIGASQGTLTMPVEFDLLVQVGPPLPSGQVPPPQGPGATHSSTSGLPASRPNSPDSDPAAESDNDQAQAPRSKYLEDWKVQ